MTLETKLCLYRSLEEEVLRLRDGSCAGTLLSLAHRYAWSGNLWHAFLTDRLLNDENAFTLSAERGDVRSSALKKAAAGDLDIIATWYRDAANVLQNEDGKDLLSLIESYDAEGVVSQVYNRSVSEKIAALNSRIVKTCEEHTSRTGQAIRALLEEFHRDLGTGSIGLHKAFRVREENGEAKIAPIRAVKHVQLDDLIGYESAKKQLIDNTEAFLAGRPANNCLLYGDAGTGKSSCIKAITGRYFAQGLRVIEVYKHQTKLLHGIIDQIKNRNYRFIVYMDDISFEDFETDYKYLKAVIEGGLEEKPENLLIYATSNRRHLIKERFSDKGAILDDDIHKNDTVQEKLSLAFRFGVTIYFGAPDRREYEAIVEGLAKRAGLQIPHEELMQEATRWEMTHGGKSGRSATQFIDYLTGAEENDARV